MIARKQPLSSSDLLTVTLFIALAAIACLMPVHNDTWWHLRAGHDMVHDRALLFVDRYSYTAHGSFFWNHSWLAQLLFYGAYALGGLPLLTALCAALVVCGWALVYRLMRGPSDLRLLLFLCAMAASTITWSVRPQVFSIVLLPVLVSLVARDRWLPATGVMLLWANLHAGMAMGVVVAASAFVAALLFDRARLLTRLAGATAVAGASLVTPLGLRNWTEMAASMARSQANHIQEWQPTPGPPENLFFWGLAALFVWQVIARWRTLATAEDRVIAVAAALALPLAIRTYRNIPAFMMIAAPAVTRLTWKVPSPATRPSPSLAARRLAAAALAMTVLVGTGIVVQAWRTPWPLLGWSPMSPGVARAIRECPGPLYNTYDNGGPIIWFVPTQPVFDDSRQDPFPVALVQAGRRVETTGDYRALFAQWHINCAAVTPTVAAVARLQQDGWTTRFRDDQWIVLARPDADGSRR